MKYTKDNIVDGIMAKIDSLDEWEGHKEVLRIKIPQYPHEIEQNVLEWVNNEPLSDIECHGESMVQIMRRWNFTEKDIPNIICGFRAYEKSHWRVPHHIWQSVTGM